jgi:predicted metal-dependent phosphoesterase TrpH
MPTKPPPLLCELHAHSSWSDGSLALQELSDLYGRRGFDVLAVTDHAPRDARQIHGGTFPAYLAAIESEARRARELYDLLVIPGIELTYDDPDPLQAAHVVAVGLRDYVALDDGLETALASARAHRATLVAAHPYSPEQLACATRGTAAFAARPELAPLVDRFELFRGSHINEACAARPRSAARCRVLGRAHMPDMNTPCVLASHSPIAPDRRSPIM